MKTHRAMNLAIITTRLAPVWAFTSLAALTFCCGPVGAQVLSASASTNPVSVKDRTGEMCVSTEVQLCNSDEAPPSGTGGTSSCPNTGTAENPICSDQPCIICSNSNTNIQGFCVDAQNSVCKQDGTAQCGYQMVGGCSLGTDQDGGPVCVCDDTSMMDTPCEVETCVPD